MEIRFLDYYDVYRCMHKPQNENINPVLIHEILVDYLLLKIIL